MMRHPRRCIRLQPPPPPPPPPRPSRVTDGRGIGWDWCWGRFMYPPWTRSGAVPTAALPTPRMPSSPVPRTLSLRPPRRPPLRPSRAGGGIAVIVHRHCIWGPFINGSCGTGRLFPKRGRVCAVTLATWVFSGRRWSLTFTARPMTRMGVVVEEESGGGTTPPPPEGFVKILTEEEGGTTTTTTPVVVVVVPLRVPPCPPRAPRKTRKMPFVWSCTKTVDALPAWRWPRVNLGSGSGRANRLSFHFTFVATEGVGVVGRRGAPPPPPPGRVSGRMPRWRWRCIAIATTPAAGVDRPLRFRSRRRWGLLHTPSWEQGLGRRCLRSGRGTWRRKHWPLLFYTMLLLRLLHSTSCGTALPLPSLLLLGPLRRRRRRICTSHVIHRRL